MTIPPYELQARALHRTPAAAAERQSRRVAGRGLGEQGMMISRRTFAGALAIGAAAGAARLAPTAPALTAPAPAARNVVLAHGLFADGSCWLDVITRLQAAGLNPTAVQNPLTTLPEAVAETQRVLDRQDGP